VAFLGKGECCKHYWL